MNLFKRRAVLRFDNGNEFDSDVGVRFDFTFKTDTDEGIPVLELKILNIKKDLRMLITDGLLASFNIGYGDSLSELTAGITRNVSEDGGEIEFEILGSSDDFFKKFQRFYDKGVREKFVLDDIAKNCGFNLQGTELLSEYKRVNGITVRGNALQTVRKIVEARNLALTISGTDVVIYDPASDEKTGDVLLRYDSGLTNVVRYTKSEKDYEFVVSALPIPQLKQGDYIRVEHDNLNADCRIIDIRIKARTNWKAKYYVKVLK